MSIQLRTIDGINPLHPRVELTHDETKVIGCGYTHCIGDCGDPALVCEMDGKRYKVMSNMVARGRVLRQLNAAWSGAIHVLPVDVAEYFKDRWWL